MCIAFIIWACLGGTSQLEIRLLGILAIFWPEIRQTFAIACHYSFFIVAIQAWNHALASARYLPTLSLSIVAQIIFGILELLRRRPHNRRLKASRTLIPSARLDVQENTFLFPWGTSETSWLPSRQHLTHYPTPPFPVHCSRFGSIIHIAKFTLHE